MATATSTASCSPSRASTSEPADGDNRDVDGEALPDVGLTGADGLEISASSLVGQPLVVNFWYSTCIPCKRELGEFAAVHREVGDRSASSASTRSIRST